MTENTTATETLSLRQLKLNDLREDLVAAQAKVNTIQSKITSLENEEANEDAIAALSAGSPVAYVYGRALNKRILSGTVVATAKNDKGVLQLKVSYGEGFDAEFHVIDAAALLMTTAQVEAAQAAIDEAKAEAAKNTPAPQAEGQNGTEVANG